MDTVTDAIHGKVRERYGQLAIAGGCCSDGACCTNDYSETDLAGLPPEAVLGLGSGNPVRHAGLRPGETVVDLGSGAGIDVFLAARLVGPRGIAIGIDMTPEMVERARIAAQVHGIENVRFHLAAIERLPLPDARADVVLSNCVINLSPDKPGVFREAHRILRTGGRLVISDVVKERDHGPMEDDCGCAATAMVREEYLETIRAVGFLEVRIVEDRPWRKGSNGVEASAVTIIARKTEREVNA